MEEIENDFAQLIGPNDDGFVIRLLSLKGRILGQIGNFKQEEDQYRICLQKCLTIFTPRHENTLEAMYRLSKPHRYYGQKKQSEELLRIVLQLGERSSITTNEATSKLSRLMSEQGQHEEAISLSRLAMKDAEQNSEFNQLLGKGLSALSVAFLNKAKYKKL
ncbi:hypothetical protein HYALB_00004701 [Hymenoscyphus albidus]|uniref:Tetratricopeptide repeat protein n=1 Tax=Hymenoscyphus albidus TaxID=595503 RepID=A0A9N9PXQ2_9HELO|nr:hypothetical protein HYALB_00004701 [Hymenoscyphus albidus]